ncbi:hypothetical protein [Mesotoga prima]|uniref:hypothetical protein n=1 Tax=Mesotoga prima TaxID=1184387 RepID=UPI002FDA02C9
MPKYLNDTSNSASINGVILKPGDIKDFPYYVYREDVVLQAYDEDSTVPILLAENSGMHTLLAEETVELSTSDIVTTASAYARYYEEDDMEYFVACDYGSAKLYFNDNPEVYTTLSAGTKRSGTVLSSKIGKITVEAISKSDVRVFLRKII